MFPFAATSILPIMLGTSHATAVSTDMEQKKQSHPPAIPLVKAHHILRMYHRSYPKVARHRVMKTVQRQLVTLPCRHLPIPVRTTLRSPDTTVLVEHPRWIRRTTTMTTSQRCLGPDMGDLHCFPVVVNRAPPQVLVTDTLPVHISATNWQKVEALMLSVRLIYCELFNSFLSFVAAYDDSDDETSTSITNNPLSPSSTGYRSRFNFSSTTDTSPGEPRSSAGRRTSRSGYTYRTREQSPVDDDSGAGI